MSLCRLQAQRNLTGIMNYTNPGAVSHNEILQMYKDYIDPDFKWSNFSVEEQAKVIVAARSNNLLDTERVSQAACFCLLCQSSMCCARLHAWEMLAFCLVSCMWLLQIEKEFPQILSIHDSLKKFVFEPNAKNKPQVLAAVKEMRGR